MLLGAHLSIAGGMENALIKAHRYAFDTVAVFVRNQRQWYAPPLEEPAAELFRGTRRELGISPVIAHGSYLVNLSGRPDVRGRSIAATAEELDRCGRLGIEYLVIHPGSHPDARAGLRLVAEALNEVLAACPHRRPIILLETTAGQGNSLGRTFEQLSAILDLVRDPGRFGVCLDTCHVFAAGYDIRTPKAYRKVMDELNGVVGEGRLRVVHVNDSLKGLGSRVDRHAHVGRGCIGLKGLANFVNDPRLAALPMILETPKGLDARGRDWDQVNAKTLRRLVRPA